MAVKRTINGLAEAGEPLIQQALDSLRLAPEAEAAGFPGDEVQRLYLLADSLYQALVDFQLLKDGTLKSLIH
nr:hypothetical protein [Pseudomonas sp. RW3S2]